MSNQPFQLNFDATQFDPRQSEGGVCLPLADYPMEIVDLQQVAVKDSNNAKGYIEVSLKVLDGQYTGQIQKDRLNVYGQEETPTRIGYQRLSAYAHIAGKLRLASSAELIGTKLIATCGPQNPPNEKYSEVKMVKDIAGNLPVMGQQSAPQPAQGAAFGGGGNGQAQPAFASHGAPAHTQGGGFPAQGQQAQTGWNNPAQQHQTQQQPAQGGGWGQAAQGAAPASGSPPWAK